VLAKKDAAIVAQVKENWTQIESLFAAHPYAINVGPVRPGTPRMVGLHPDHPNPKAKKKKNQRPGSLNWLHQLAHFDGAAEEALLEKELGWASLTLSL